MTGCDEALQRTSPDEDSLLGRRSIRSRGFGEVKTHIKGLDSVEVGDLEGWQVLGSGSAQALT